MAVRTLGEALVECVETIRAAREAGLSWCMKCGGVIAVDGCEDELGEIELCLKCSAEEAERESELVREYIAPHCECEFCRESA